ncbi:MAG: hypothetical protein ABI761_18420 [Saprospiraceae bacterium]
MFWETCAKHSFEIIVALMGSGLLGYLWSRWFNDGRNSIVDNSAYENQIRSLRDRIKQQDIDLLTSASLKDTWILEKQSLVQQTNSLTAELDTIKESFSGYVSPNDLEDYQQKYETSINAVNQHQDKLIAERNGLLTFIKSLEAKIAQNSIHEASVTNAEAKINDLENKLHLALTARNVEEQTQSNEKQKHDAALLHAKETEIIDLKSKLQQAGTRSQDYENQIQKLKESQAEKDKSFDHLIQSSQDADIKAKELDKHYNSLIAAKEEELRIKTEQISNASNLIQSELTQKITELNNLTLNNQRLATEVELLNAAIQSATESEQAANSKSNEFQSRFHQFEQEAISSKSEVANLKSKMADIEKLQISLLESDKKQKEWEARWKEASTEAEQYKLAHSQSIREKDDYKSHLNTLEANLADAKRQFDEILHDHENVKVLHTQTNTDKEDYFKLISQLEYELSTSKAQINDLREMNERTASEHAQVIKERDEHRIHIDQLESNLNTFRAQLNAVQKDHEDFRDLNNQSLQKQAILESSLSEKDELIKSLNKQLNESNYYGGEWEGRFKEANAKLNNLSEELAQANTGLTEAHHKLHESTESYNQRENELAELNDTIQSLMTEREKNQQTFLISKDISGEWETKYNDINTKYNSELAKAQQTIAIAKTTASELESRNKDLNNKFNTIQLQLVESQKSNVLLETETKNSTELQDKYSAEVKEWQKRITDLESEKSNTELLFQSRHTKEIENHKKQIVRLLDLVANLKSEPGTTATALKKEIKDEILPTPVKPGTPTRPARKARPISLPAAEEVPVTESTRDIKQVQEIKSTVLDLKSASTIFGKKIRSNDHKIIEGVGPKIDVLLKKNKIINWVQLSNTPIRDIQIILDKGGNKFSLADPTSWPAQARLASMGEWNELKKLQAHLTAGKAKKKSRKQSTTKPKPVSKNLAAISAPQAAKAKVKKAKKPIDLIKGKDIMGVKFTMDDLKIVEGIGPKIEKLLHKANIKTWKTLASAKTKTIQAILDKGGNRFTLADPKTWRNQSKLAASGNWTRLKSLQDRLKGGK